MFYSYSYMQAPKPITLQGSVDKLHNYLRNHPDLMVVGGGNGSYIIGGVSLGQILEFEGENSTTPIRAVTPNKDKMREYLDKKRITESDYRELAWQLNTGMMTFDELMNKF